MHWFHEPGGDMRAIHHRIVVFVVVCCAATGFAFAQAARWGIVNGRIPIPNREDEHSWRQFWGAVIASVLLALLAIPCLFGAVGPVR